MHMKQHGKKRFIQFGNTLHEVHVSVETNQYGQKVQEYSLVMLLSDDEKKTNEF